MFAVLAGSLPALAQPTTPEFQNVLKAMKLGPSFLPGIERELAVPRSWIAAANKEGVVNVRITLDEREFSRVASVFNARYPGIKFEHVRGIGQRRVMQPLLAFKRGTILSDVLFAIDSNEQDFREANAFTSLAELPALGGIPASARAGDDMLASPHAPHNCMSYNTKRVKKEELPKTWEDLVDNPRWHNGKVGMAVNIHTWVAPLAGIKGDAWARDYIRKVFTVLKPQQRKEQLSMTARLNAMGEYDIGVPLGDYGVRPLEDSGMSVSLHCPDIVPKGNTSFAIVRGTQRPNAARVFVNWALSKEGQITLAWAGQFIPTHKDLQIAEMLPYPREVLGKRIAHTDAAVQAKFPWIAAEFGKYWTVSDTKEN